jgi:hypothetical protein
LGQEETFWAQMQMSALPLKGDIDRQHRHVRFVPEPDMRHCFPEGPRGNNELPFGQVRGLVLARRYWRQSPLSETRAWPFPARLCGRMESPYGAPVLRIERRSADTHHTFPTHPPPNPRPLCSIRPRGSISITDRRADGPVALVEVPRVFQNFGR